MQLVDSTIRDIITTQLGGNEAKIILESMEKYMLQNNVITAPPLVGDGKTKGDWRINLTMPDGQKQDIRPDSALSYTIIREMLKSGPIRFALEMKRAQMVSVFRNNKSVSVYSKNEELAKITEFVVEHVLPYAAFEFTWSALVYGSAFMEQVWETKTLSQLGLDGSKLYTVPKQLNLVPHDTVRHIRRTNEGDFDGFVQMADYRLGTYYVMSTPNGVQNPGDILVKAESALVIPYNGFSRNLWGESFLYTLYPLWFWYEIIIRCLVRYSELMGDPPRLGKAPSRKKVRLDPNSDELVDAIDYLLALAVNLSRSQAVVIPSDVDEQGKPEWELGYMQTPDRSQPFVQIIELFNQMILRAALSGDRAYTQVAGGTGSNAIGQVHAEATALHNEMVVSSWVHFLNQYWISNISKYNLGQDGVPVWLEVQGLDPKEREFLTSVANIAGNSATFNEFFYQVDWRGLGKSAGLPMLSEDESKKLKEELAKQSQEDQVNQIRTQNELSIESQEAQMQIQQKYAPKEEKPKEKTTLEIQQKVDQFTSGKVPIFFSGDEVKKILLEKEEVVEPRKHFFTGSKSQNRKLAMALAVAYKYNQNILLFNPFHDNLGRFSSGGKSGFSRAKQFVKEHKKEIAIAGVVGIALLAAGGAVYLSKNSPEERIFYAKTNKWKGTIDFISPTTLNNKPDKVEAEATLAGKTAVVMNELNEMGISGFDHKKVIFASEGETTPFYNVGAYNSTKKEVKFSVDVTESLLYDYDPEFGMEMAAHEFYHARIAAAKDKYRNGTIEEGLATITGSIVGKRVKEKRMGGKITRQDLDGLTEHIDKIYDPSYAEKAKKLFNLSKIGKYSAGARDEYEYLVKWITSTPETYGKSINEILNLAHFEGIELESVLLFNPFHDSLGRFASGAGGAIKRGAKAVGKFAKENEAELITAGIIAGAAVAGGTAHYQFKKGLPEAKEYRKLYGESTSLTQKIIATPAEYLARKHSYGALIARSALGAGGLTTSTVSDNTFEKVVGTVLPYGLGPSMFLSLAAGGAIYAKGSILGVAATAAFATAVFGAAAPSAALVIGGVIVGSAASLAAYQLVDYAGKRFTQAYIRRYAPKDPYHITITENEKKRKTFTRFALDEAGILSIYSFANLVTTLLEEENDNLMASVVPLVAMMCVDNRVKKISSSFEIPGFTKGGNEWFLTKDLAPNFIKLWAGDSTQLENITLFNSTHDELGRFAPKQGFAFKGGLEAKRPVKIGVAKKLTAMTIKEVKKKMTLVDGLEVSHCSEWSCVKEKTGLTSNALGVYKDKKLVVTPYGMSFSSYDHTPFYQRIVAHEATHARKRSQGGGIAFRNQTQADLEEGTTELISLGLTKYPSHKSPYYKQMKSVAYAARKGANNNHDRAWQIVSLMHYHNDTSRGVSAYQAYTGSSKFNKGSDADIEWLLGSMPTRLESEDDYIELFKKSEKEIYKEIRKVQNETFSDEVIPFSEEEFNETETK
jgi:hypothetical protein